MIKLRPFDYFEPSEISEASQILSNYGNRAKILAGGLDLIPRMRRHEIKPDCIINIQNIKDLDYIKCNSSEGIAIGALASIRSVEVTTFIKNKYQALFEAAHNVVSIQVKTTGTLVGNLCVASPASDIAPALFVLGAKIRIIGNSSERLVPIDAFISGVNQTVLEQGEIVKEILIPRLPDSTESAFCRLSWTTENIAKVNVAAAITRHDDEVSDMKIALGSVAPTPIRAKKAEDILRGKKFNLEMIDHAAELASNETQPINDIRATAEYRKKITKILVKSAIENAWKRLKDKKELQ